MPLSVSPRSEFYGTVLMIAFEFSTDDRDSLIETIRGVTSTAAFWEDEDYPHRLTVWVRSENDAALIRVAASDDILQESWHLISEDADFEMGAVYDHRIGGPAVIDYTRTQKRRESFRLWDRVLPNEASYQRAIADGVAEDPDAFLAWLKARALTGWA